MLIYRKLKDLHGFNIVIPFSKNGLRIIKRLLAIMILNLYPIFITLKLGNSSSGGIEAVKF
jgi:hypothetical protein